MPHRPWSWLLSTEMARRMYILFTIQSLQRGISHRSCSQKGHLGRWVVGWGVVLGVDIGIGGLPPLLLGFHTRSGVGEILGLLALQSPSCEHWLTTRSYITRRQEDARWSIVWQNTLRQLPLLWTMIDFLSNTTPHSINSGEDARRWSYSLMDLPGQGRVPRPN